MKILLVEDDTLISAALAKLLTANQYEIDIAGDGQTGLDMAIAVEYDLILLDLQLPNLDGISLCKKLRLRDSYRQGLSQGYSKPILLLTAKNSNPDLVAGLDAGADDYVIKPYNSEALLARIRALFRRSGASDLDSSSSLTWGNLCLNLTAATVTFGKEIISLTATEYKLLELFLQNPNRIFTRSAILDRLWEFDDPPTERAINTHIKDLRKKLKGAGFTEDIIETIYGMGYRLKPYPKETPENSSTPATQIDKSKENKPKKDIKAVNRVLEKFRNSFHAQVSILAQANTAILGGYLDPELHQNAKHEAHKLAGSMGSFGYPEGSRLAREIEHLLINDRPLTPGEISRFSDLVKGLEQELTKTPVTARSAPVNTSKNYRVLVIDDDPILTEKLLAEAELYGVRIKVTPNLAAARSRLALATPDVVLLDLTFPDTEEDGLILLRELKDKFPQLPVIVFTGRDSLADRLAVSRLGARQFIHKPATTEQIFQAISRVLPQEKTSEARVLIVDDDPAAVVTLSGFLNPWGLQVITLTKPERFWEMLIINSPNLVVLDWEMPKVSGLDLCQVIRQDVQWGNLPILVVTAHTDAESLSQAFAAGADDFITKPVLGPELVTRVLSRIERMRWRSVPASLPENKFSVS
ncbi:response regulator [Limnofasciculus baicalensis]|uniref:Response regulator n=1 Tax=Limnofasciculus baicalensis BBK-W-15 TaxID=2699891 RepID=A0AAE3KM04_9CYAN|nr:response regulator [Limnofasciculus baicalensis]MCP2728684.1 response regulator [Limnofasciculus baicalensis BBK-W-15]